MRNLFAWTLFAVTAPWTFLVGYGWALLMWASRAAENFRWEEHGILTAEWTAWVIRPRKWLGIRKGADGKPIKRGNGWEYRSLWDYSTTIGRTIIYQPWMRRPKLSDPLTRVEQHERVHVRQFEDMMLIALFVGLGTMYFKRDAWLTAAVWFSGGCWQAADFLTAAMRGGHFYRDSEHERSAYAQTDVNSPAGSWLDQRMRTRAASGSASPPSPPPRASRPEQTG